MILSELTFKTIGLEQVIVNCLNQLNFIKPSDIQEKAIPPCLSGKDVIIQAHAGTGKTLCYLSSLAQLGINNILPYQYQRIIKILQNDDKEIIQNIQNVSIKIIFIYVQIRPYSLILVPTRELAIQIMENYTRLTQLIIQNIQDQNINNINIHIENISLYKELLFEVFQPKLFIGGLPIDQDRDVLKLKRCSIVIGTLGRIMQLVQEGCLVLHDMKLIILDEADKLYENKHFQSNFKKIMLEIIGKHQENNRPQILSFSATYPEKPLEYFKSFMNQPLFVSTVLDDKIIQDQTIKDPNNLSLSNLEQFYYLIQIDDNKSKFQHKVQTITQLLKPLNFRQTIIFYNDKNRGENLFNDLRAEGFKPIFIHGDQSQSDRIKVMHQMRRNKVNLIISTDLLSRGIDVETLDIVIHFDLPVNVDTYFHRIGRTGRFGSYGFSILLFDMDKEENIKKFYWTNQWQDDQIQRIDSNLQQKYKQQQKKNEDIPLKKEYFGEFLNGISVWRDKNYQFYDESKFKYKDNNNNNNNNNKNNNNNNNNNNNINNNNNNNNNHNNNINTQQDQILFQRKQNKIQIKKQHVLQTQELNQNNKFDEVILNQIFSCPHCKEFANQLEQFQQGEKLKIKNYFR